ncbi:hypothetical protein [Paraburkholderia sp. RL17-337-BIB-A]|uniref:hypothetical protein n=1 Tax=Paraburkholderia sp. RL17-337-BIB-A TaxID=3031636 RepID=UPI0038BD798E
MSTEFLKADDFTNIAVDIEASDPKALMVFWEKTPAGTRVSQTLTRSLSFADVGALLIMVKDGVDLAVALIELGKTLRGIKESNPDLSLRLRVRYGTKVTDSELGPLRTTEWGVEFKRQSKSKFIGDETLLADARRRGIDEQADDQ